MEKQLINEAKRMQQLAGVVNEIFGTSEGKEDKNIQESTKYDLVGSQIKKAAQDYTEGRKPLSNREYALVFNAFIEGILWKTGGIRENKNK